MFGIRRLCLDIFGTSLLKVGSLWVAWVDTNWLKGRSFWQIPIPQSCSWSWKQILKLREVAKRFLKFKVGDGNRLFLWLDDWHPDGCLLDKYGCKTVDYYS